MSSGTVGSQQLAGTRHRTAITLSIKIYCTSEAFSTEKSRRCQKHFNWVVIAFFPKSGKHV
jgi:hypothetical protein